MGFFTGKVYTVTGAGSGIAREVTLILAKKGATVYASDINAKGLEQTKSLAEGKVVIDTVDVRDADAVEAWVKSCFDKEGRLDGSANCAGVNGGSEQATILEKTTHSEFDFVMAVNLGGMFNCMKSQLSRIARPGGSIVNIASSLGLFGQPTMAPYAASKHGVNGLTKSAAAECGRDGIRINAVCPGPIDTAIFRDCEVKGMVTEEQMAGTTLLGRMGHPKEVAQVIVFLLSDKSSYVTGAIWSVDAGFTTTSN